MLKGDSKTDPRLLANVADASPDAWSKFYGTYADMIRKTGMSVGLERADADDLLQNLMVRLIDEIREFKHDPNVPGFRKWLRTVAANEARNFRRKHSNRQRLISEAAAEGTLPLPAGRSSADVIVDEGENFVETRRFLRELVERYFVARAPEESIRVVVRQLFLEGMKPPLIAEATGETQVNVRAIRKRVVDWARSAVFSEQMNQFGRTDHIARYLRKLRGQPYVVRSRADSTRTDHLFSDSVEARMSIAIELLSKFDGQPGPALIWRGENGEIERISCEVERVIGRESGFDGWREDNRLSRRHFRVEGSLLRDLGSHNHTHVNERPRDEIRLIHGDLVRAGGQWFVFQSE